ncbi:MAG: acetyl-CoA synthetase, partial [Thermoprotei archaeon]
PLLKGYRGREPLDEDAIVDIMIKVSKMIEENPMISQLDLNPIIVYTKGAKVVDARIILET